MNNAAEDRNGWETLSRTTHFKDGHLEVVTDEVRTPGRSGARRWTIVRRKAAVVVAPVTREGRFVLIKQERIPIRAALWEMPAGQIDDTQKATPETIEAAALRELREETGFELAAGGDLVALGDFFSSPGFTDEHCYFFLARPVEQGAGGRAHDESESILDCRSFTAKELGRMISENEIRDANTLSICARLIARGFLTFDLP